MDGDTVVIGAPDEDSSTTEVNGDGINNDANLAGAAYVFARNSTAWNLQAYLKASDTDELSWFGRSVAVDGDTVVVGAIQEMIGIYSGNNASGSAYVFVRSEEAWSQQACLETSSPDVGDWFGASVSIDGDTAVVGAPYEDSSAIGVDGDEDDNGAKDAGAAYIFVRNEGTWSQQAYLKASDTRVYDEFGGSVSIDGDTVAVGASVGMSGGESAYVFVRGDGAWSEETRLYPSHTISNDEFGCSVSVDDGIVVVGARREDSSSVGVGGDVLDNSASNSGAAYVFDLAYPNLSFHTIDSGAPTYTNLPVPSFTRSPFHPPGLRIQTRRIIHTSKNRIRIKGVAVDRNGDLKRVEARNNRTTPARKYRKAKGNIRNRSRAIWRYVARLKPGRNVIKVRAWDTTRRRSLMKRVIVLKSAF